MGTPTSGNDFLHDLEIDVRMELAETGQPQHEADGGQAAEELLDPDAERYEIGLRNLLGAIEAAEWPSA